MVGLKDKDGFIKVRDNCKWLNKILDEYEMQKSNIAQVEKGSE